MLSLHYHEIMGKNEEYEGKNIRLLMIICQIKILDKIKETIGVVTFDDTKVLTDTDDKIPDYTTLKML